MAAPFFERRLTALCDDRARVSRRTAMASCAPFAFHAVREQ
jgi:hypothetical protein